MSSGSVQNISRTLAASISLSLSYFAYARSLVPLYGESATHKWLRPLIIAVIGAASSAPVPIHSLNLIGLASILLTTAPTSSYWVAVFTSRKHDPVKGTAITHGVVILPIVFLLSTVIARSQTTGSAISRRLIAFAISYASILSGAMLWSNALLSVTDSQVFLTIAGSLLTLAFLESVPATTTKPQNKKGKSLSKPNPLYKLRFLLAAPALLTWTYFAPLTLSSPVLRQPLAAPYNHPKFPLRIYSSNNSVTGLISVGEGLPPPPDSGLDKDSVMFSIRYLRASHSILGGVWMHNNVMSLDGNAQSFDSLGTPLGDSIYGAFVLQEAARLVDSTKIEFKEALTIGLGTGIAARAFSLHGMGSTIVEIDPAVYHAARTYFGLPDPGPDRVFLEDARQWVTKTKTSTDARQYDVVVHDCFSGGGVPEHIFTVEFWTDLKAIMNPDGVLAVNIAGAPDSDSSRAIIVTLESVFSHCRAFHDSAQPLADEEYKTKFVNIVFFCTPNTTPLTFRDTRHSDFLNSPLRRHLLNSLSNREVDLVKVRGPKEDSEQFSSLILTDEHNPLGKWQEEGAIHHWSMMREVLDDVFWETY